MGHWIQLSRIGFHVPGYVSDYIVGPTFCCNIPVTDLGIPAAREFPQVLTEIYRSTFPDPKAYYIYKPNFDQDAARQ